jgi:FkbM family methyltransferase
MRFLRSLFLHNELFWRPQILIRSIHRVLFKASRPELCRMSMPWGATLNINTSECVGSEIYYWGVLDSVVVESLHRLIDDGDVVVDAGANIGQMTTLMQHLAGDRGSVIPIEAHPAVYTNLCQNIDQAWEKPRGNVQPHNIAISDHSGSVQLRQPTSWSKNQGTASLETDAFDTDFVIIHIPSDTLTNVIQPHTKIHLLKMDVEGHEAAVLNGASKLLETGSLATRGRESSIYYSSTITHCSGSRRRSSAQN